MSKFIDFYEPAEDSFLLQEQVKKHANGKVLDMGTGSGIQALTASSLKEVISTLAIDINPLALNHTKAQAKIKHVKLTVKLSNQFENINDQFDTIICNPPYLPQDAHIEDPALYGGIKGHEWSERFITQVSDHLTADGQILFLFSTLTGKEKIDELLKLYLLEYELLSTGKIPFETLYIYKITKSPLRKEIESHHVHALTYHAKGKRGIVYKGLYTPAKTKTEIPVAIKIKNPRSEAQNRLSIEAQVLTEINKEHIGPKLLFSTPHFLCLEFIDGLFLEEYLTTASYKIALTLLQDILTQCYTLDQLQYTKEEMHHPQKHILITSSNHPPTSSINTPPFTTSRTKRSTKRPLITAVMIDFERATKTNKPQNITQTIEYYTRNKAISTILHLDPQKSRELAQIYKKDPSFQNFENIIKTLFTQNPPPIKTSSSKL